jgi:hypothetical protein
MSRTSFLLRFFTNSIFLLAFCWTAQAQNAPWQQIRSLSTMHTIFIVPTSIGLFTVDIDTNSLVFSNNNAQSWVMLPTVLKRPFPYINSLAESKNSMFFAEYLNVVTRSSKDSLLVASPQDIVLPFLQTINNRYEPNSVTARDSLVLIASPLGLFRSINEGVTFERTYPRDAYTLNRILIDHNRIWASSTRGVDISSDKGESWSPKGFDKQYVYIAAASAHCAFVFRYLGVDTTEIHRSLDTGTTWQKNLRLDRGRVQGMVIHERRTFLASDSGVYISSDYGSTWRDISYNLPKGRIINLALDTNTKTLYVGINRGGLYRTDATTVGIREEQASSAFLSTLAPNPATDFTDISFTLPHAASTQISLYSTLGTEVWQSASGVLPAGEQRLRIDTRGLPSGVYTYRLVVGGVRSVGRIVVVR